MRTKWICFRCYLNARVYDVILNLKGLEREMGLLN